MVRSRRFRRWWRCSPGRPPLTVPRAGWRADTYSKCLSEWQPLWSATSCRWSWWQERANSTSANLPGRKFCAGDVRSHCIEPAQHHVGNAPCVAGADPWPMSPLAGEYLPQIYHGGALAGRRARSGRPVLRPHGANRRRPVPRPPGGASRPARAQPRPVSRAAALVFISSPRA